MPAENEPTTALSYPGGEHAMSIAKATEGNDGIELGKLLAETGYTTLDPGFVNTASTKSAITYIDGEKGILRYRGYPIEQLAEKASFIEVSYLLIYGELPTSDQLETFTDKIRRHTLLHEDLKRFFDGFPRNAHPCQSCRAPSTRSRRTTRTRSTPTTRSRSSCRRSACSPSSRRSPPTPTRSPWASRSSTRTTRCRWSRTSCG